MNPTTPIKTFKNLILAGLTAGSLLGVASKGEAQTTVTVDSTQPFIGFMNVSELPSNGGGYDFGEVWGTADLRAFFTGSSTLTLTPNTNVYNPTNTYYVNADGSGNKTMDASFYVQNDTLAGQTLTFTGTCLTNSLVSPYVCTAFIKDFAPDYSFNTPVTASLTAGQTFSITLSTTVGHHIQYGFETVGPDAKPASLASLGQVVVAVNDADPTLSTVPSEALVEGQTAQFTVNATGTKPFTYQWAYGTATDNTSLSDGGRISGSTSNTLTISNVTATDAGPYSVEVINGLGSSAVATANLSVVPLAQAKTNLLIDPSFESGMFTPTSDAGWVSFNGAAEVNTNDFYYLSTNPVSVLDGADAVQTYSTGTGSYNGIYQDRPAIPGQLYTASAWLLTPGEDEISGAGQCWLEIQFQNSGGGVVGFYKSSIIDSNSPTNVWINVQATNHLATDLVTFLNNAPYMVAPPGTTSVRVQITHHADTGGSVYVDLTDFRLRAPVPVGSAANKNMKITFPTLYGPTYQVFYKSNLTDTPWQMLTNLPGDGTTKTVTDPMGNGKRFYSVNTQ